MATAASMLQCYGSIYTKRMLGSLYTCSNNPVCENSSVLMIWQHHWMPCISFQLAGTHCNPPGRQWASFCPHSLLLCKTTHYIVTTHAVSAHTYTHRETHTHASTSLKCSPPELSPNICGAGYGQPKWLNLVNEQHYANLMHECI